MGKLRIALDKDNFFRIAHKKGGGGSPPVYLQLFLWQRKKLIFDCNENSKVVSLKKNFHFFDWNSSLFCFIWGLFVLFFPTVLLLQQIGDPTILYDYFFEIIISEIINQYTARHNERGFTQWGVVMILVKFFFFSLFLLSQYKFTMLKECNYNDQMKSDWALFT